MKKVAILACALSLAAGAALAQPASHDVGIFGDPAGATSSVAAAASTPFTAFVVGFDLDGLVKGYEVAFDVPAGFFLLSAVPNPSTGLNFGDVDGEFIVGTGGCFEGQPTYTLVTATFLPLTLPQDVAICVHGTVPSSFPNGLPGYLQCDGTKLPFGVAQNGEGRYPNGCLIVNPSQGEPVATETVSFGEVKGRF